MSQRNIFSHEYITTIEKTKIKDKTEKRKENVRFYVQLIFIDKKLF